MLTAGWLTIGLSSSKATFYYWYNIGPQPISTTNMAFVIDYEGGPVATAAVDPSNPNHWLIGAALGGIWESTDAGTNWYPRTDTQASLAMGAIAFAPNNPSLVYAGTGDANFRGDNYAGEGLLESQNGGTAWQMLNTNFAKTSFSCIQVDHANYNNLSVATARGGGGVGEESSGSNSVPGAPPTGVFVSTNGGTNFTQILTGQATALVAKRVNFNLQYAGLGEIYGNPTNGVYRTTNDWQTFQLVQGPWITTTYVYTNYPIATNFFNGTNTITYTNYIIGTNFSAGGRIAIAESPSSPNTLYVGVAEVRSRYTASLRGIWMTTDAWAVSPTWTLLPAPAVQSDGVSLPRFWYDFDLLVDSADATVLYLGENNLWRYSGGVWTPLGDWIHNQIHPQFLAMAWVPGSGLLVGNDGGVYLSDAAVSGVWTTLNEPLSITEFYKGAVDATGENFLDLGGAQADFTSVWSGDLNWPEYVVGTGGDCAIASGNPLNHWAASLDTQSDDDFNPNAAQILRTESGSVFFHNVAADISDGLPFTKQFFVHYEKAPFNDDLVIAGTATLWRCNDFFSGTVPSWIPNSPTMFGADGKPMPISAMAFAPSDTSGKTYAFGTEDGQLLITANGGGAWNNPDPNDVLPGRYVSGMAFNPFDSNTLYVAFSGYDEGTPGQPGHLFKTTNAFAATPAWTNISPPVDLPNDCVAVDPNDGVNVFVGTDIGVWNSIDGGNTWAHYGPANGMPNVPVYDLRFTSASRLTAFTHGRGAYLFTPINIPILVFPIGDLYHPTPNCLTCPPDILRLNPGDYETIQVPLENIVEANTVDLKVTMLPSANVTPESGTQDYGVVQGQGPPVSRQFQFIVSGGAGGASARVPGAPQAGASCGDTVQLTFQLSDQGVDLGQVTIPVTLGVTSHPLIEDFEELPPPGLSPGWTSAASGGDVPWTTTTNPPPNSPQMGSEGLFIPPPRNTSVMVPDSAGIGESTLTSPPFNVVTPQAQLYFREAFAVSNAFDGGILEIAIGSQPFQEIVQAGGSFVEGGYNVTLADNNPLGPRPGWSGDSGGWLSALVNLPPAAAGQTVQLRWVFATSRGQTNGAWFVDSVDITESVCLPAVSNPIILNPSASRNTFSFEINTVPDRNYIIQYKTNLTDAVWQTLETLPGNGNEQVVNVPIGSKTAFYRFTVQ